MLSFGENEAWEKHIPKTKIPHDPLIPDLKAQFLSSFLHLELFSSLFIMSPPTATETVSVLEQQTAKLTLAASEDNNKAQNGKVEVSYVYSVLLLKRA